MTKENDQTSSKNTSNLEGVGDFENQPASPQKPPLFAQTQSILGRAAIETVPVRVTFSASMDAADRVASSTKSKSVQRIRYEAEVAVIRRKLGSLEQIRKDLGLTQRKMCQLLMVDPSAWTRWTRGGEDAPPHIYRMLQWYLALEDKYPALDPTFWLSAVAKVREPDETDRLRREISVLKEESLLSFQRGSAVHAETNAELMRTFESRMREAEKLAAQRLWWILAIALLGSLIAGFLGAVAIR